MPMTDEELVKLIQAVRNEVPESLPVVKSRIDTALSILPVGSKTLTGWIGGAISIGATVVAANPQLLDFSTGNWQEKVAGLLAGVFFTLSGAGGIAKWQRGLLIAQQGNELMAQVLKKLQEQARQ